MPINMEKVKQELLLTGLFSEYLPSCFNLELEANKYGIFTQCPIARKKDLIEPYTYTMSRFTENDKRRTIFLPEITAYLKAIKYMKDNQIIDFLANKSQSSDYSFSKLVQDDGKIIRHEKGYNSPIENENEFPKSNYLSNIVKKLNMGKGANGILCLDIANFYASIYSHALVIIALGFEETMKQYKNDPSKDISLESTYKIYKKLDELIRAQNGGRTNGILTGPILSNFLAEGYLLAIDEVLENNGFSFIRYVDDYEFFIFNEYELDKIKIKIEKIFSQFYLSLNNEKTKYIKFPYYVIENLEKIYGSIVTDPFSPKLTQSGIIELFSTFFEIEERGVKGAIRYLIKTIDREIEIEDKGLFTTYLINILVNDNKSLIKVSQFILERRSEVQIDEKFIKGLVKHLELCIANSKELETIWLLYILINLCDFNVYEHLIDQIIDSSNELAMVLILVNNKDKLDNQKLEKLKTSLHSWIGLYQLYAYDLITEIDFFQNLGIKYNQNAYK